ncbi:hypothetical protein HPB51_009907 [Rhipicephalus microplus]|uniref:HTH CENPB-type domain-containing protein n=1 Tax=Rhipicephalus microplus TaxID=6941 RepID=A0A9J6ETG8_RHIMP|nr:hypothetical protein HPB51_009907 [Rhipicephalus microplus]
MYSRLQRQSERDEYDDSSHVAHIAMIAGSILEDACKKQRLNPSEYDLYHHERPLSHSLPVSFTNLPNNAELELRAAANGQRRTASVDICLQLENGERLMAKFPASASLFDVVSHWPDNIEVQDADQKMDLVCVYMRQEIVGTEQLRATTLQNLGLTSGRAAIRVLHRPKGCVVQQAHVSRHFAVPFKKGEDPPAAQNVSPTQTQVAPTSPTRPTSPKLPRPVTPVQDVATSPTRPRSASPKDVDMKSPSSGRSPTRGNDAADHKVRFSPPPATTKAETPTVREEDIKYIGERKAVLFNLEHCPPLKAVMATPKKRQNYDAKNLATKVEILEALKNDESRQQVMTKYNVKRSTLGTYVKSEQQIRQAFESEKFHASRKRLRTAAHPQLEEALLRSITDCRNAHLPLSGPLIMAPVEKYAAMMNIESFKASEGWLARF